MGASLHQLRGPNAAVFYALTHAQNNHLARTRVLAHFCGVFVSCLISQVGFDVHILHPSLSFAALSTRRSFVFNSAEEKIK